MKWKNKGHEYDEMFANIEKKNKFYLFGAGDYGNQFFNIMHNELTLCGYIDNSPAKKGKRINGMICTPLAEINISGDEGIILTMSQIARVNAIVQLEECGYKKNEDYFIIEEFLSVYFAYKKDMVYFSAISFLPSTACNLNCRYCLNFNPFAKKFYVREWDDLVKDVDLFFACVDRIMLFHVSGGEPFIYKNTAKLLEYINDNYGDRIDTLRTVTNGTQVPSKEVLEILAKCNVEVTVDDYRETVPKFNDRFDELIKCLDAYNIKYFVNKADSWVDLAPEKTDYSDKDEEWIIAHRDFCNQSWQELRDGKLYSCNYAAYATVAGIAGDQDMEETYDLSKFDDSKKKELVEFRLGYTTKGYTAFCRKCRGFTPENKDEKEPAVQMGLNETI